MHGQLTNFKERWTQEPNYAHSCGSKNLAGLFTSVSHTLLSLDANGLSRRLMLVTILTRKKRSSLMWLSVE